MRMGLRSVFKWILWALLAQFVLINISGFLYAYKLTHFYEPAANAGDEPRSKNIFVKTWRLFKGPIYRKIPIEELPGVPYQTVKLVTKIACHWTPGIFPLIHQGAPSFSFMVWEVINPAFLSRHMNFDTWGIT